MRGSRRLGRGFSAEFFYFPPSRASSSRACASACNRASRSRSARASASRAPCQRPAGGGVKPPVLGDAETGVIAALVTNVLAAGALRCYFQHEIGGLARFGDDVAVAPFIHFNISVKGDQQIRTLRTRQARHDGAAEIVIPGDQWGFLFRLHIVAFWLERQGWGGILGFMGLL